MSDRKPMPGAMPAELAERESDVRGGGPSEAELREQAAELAHDIDWLHDELGSDISEPIRLLITGEDDSWAVRLLRAALIARAYKELT